MENNIPKIRNLDLRDEKIIITESEMKALKEKMSASASERIEILIGVNKKIYAAMRWLDIKPEIWKKVNNQIENFYRNLGKLQDLIYNTPDYDSLIKNTTEGQKIQEVLDSNFKAITDFGDNVENLDKEEFVQRIFSFKVDTV